MEKNVAFRSAKVPDFRGAKGDCATVIDSRVLSTPTILTAMAPEACNVERYSDGTVLVRVHSRDRSGRRLPDAVFTFCIGDPQYAYWAARAVPVEDWVEPALSN